MSRARKGLLIGLALLFLLGPHAAMGADGVPAPAQQDQNAMGADSMMPAPAIRGGNQPLSFEQYGGLDFALNVDHPALLFQGPIGAAVNEYLNAVASMVTYLLVITGTVITRMIMWAFSLDLVAALGGPVGTVVNSLHANLYDRYLPIILGLVGLWVAWALLVHQRFLRGAMGVAWALAMALVGLWFLSSPVEYMSTANGFGNEMGGVVLAGVAGYDPANGHGATTSSGDATNAEVRLFADRMWYSTTYLPWTVVEFGQVDPKVNNQQLGVELLRKNHKLPNSFDQDISQAPQPVKDWFAGKHAGERVALASISLVFAIAEALLVGALALALLFAGIALLLLTMTAPLFLLLGPIPGHGRRLLERWFELVLGALLTKVIVGALLATVLVLDGALVGLAGSLGWFMSVVLRLILLWAAWHLRHHLMAAGRQISHPRVTNQRHQDVRRTSNVTQTTHRALAHHRSQLPAVNGVQKALPAKAGAQAGATANGQRQTISAGPWPSQVRTVFADGTKSAAVEVGSASAKARRVAPAAAKGATGAAGQAGTTGAATAGAAGTAGGTLVALGALKAGQAVIRGHEAARLGLQRAVGGHLVSSAEGPAAISSGSRSQLPARSAQAPSHDSVMLGTARLAGGAVVRKIPGAQQIPPPQQQPRQRPQRSARKIESPQPSPKRSASRSAEDPPDQQKRKKQ